MCTTVRLDEIPQTAARAVTRAHTRFYLIRKRAGRVGRVDYDPGRVSWHSASLLGFPSRRTRTCSYAPCGSIAGSRRGAVDPGGSWWWWVVTVQSENSHVVKPILF